MANPILSLPPGYTRCPTTIYGDASTYANKVTIPGLMGGVGSWVEAASDKPYNIGKQSAGDRYRFEVRQGDNGNRFDSPSVDRAEFAHSGALMAFDTDYWGAGSFMVTPEFFGAPTAAWALILQHHDTPDAEEVRIGVTKSPPFAVQFAGTTFQISTRTDPAVTTTVNATETVRYSSAGIQPSNWNGLVYRIRYNVAGAAILQVWLNGVQVLDLSGISIGYNDLAGMYLKFGIYRARTASRAVVHWANPELSASTLFARVAAPRDMSDFDPATVEMRRTAAEREAAFRRADHIQISASSGTVRAGWPDVPHLDKNWQAETLQSTPPYMRDARSLGEPSLGAGAIYPIPESEFVIAPFQIPDFFTRAYGLDVGWKTTAAIFGARDPGTDVVYLYTEHFLNEAEPTQHATAIKGRGVWIPGVIDPAAQGRSQVDGQQLIVAYRSLGLNVAPAHNAVQAGLDMVWQRLATGRLKVFSTCSQWLREYRIYRRDENGRVVKEFDHLMDATRYLIVSGIARMMVEPRKALGYGNARNMPVMGDPGVGY